MSRAIVVAAGLLLLVGAAWVGHRLTPRVQVVETAEGALAAARCTTVIRAVAPRHCIAHDGRWVCAAGR